MREPRPINFNTKAMAALRLHPRVDEIENEGMDEHRFFVHLKPGFCFTDDPCQPTHTRSFGGAVEAMKAMATETKACGCAGCQPKRTDKAYLAALERE